MFSYLSGPLQSDSFTLGPLSFNLLANHYIGIVGTSGGGKSTLLNLLSAKILPTSGSIVLSGGKDFIDSFHHRDIYASLVSLISQETHLFSESLCFNISFSTSVSPEVETFYREVKNNLSYLAKWNLNLEDKLDVNKLSEGQRQLICALRALYFKRPLVLFDEIAAGMDSELDASLKEVMLMNRRHSILVIIAHRIETLFDADEIFYIDNGKITARGPHKDLLATSESYRKIVDELTI